MIRLAVPADAPALREIYAKYIDTPITFEYALPTEAEYRARMESILAEYPYLVYAREGRPMGFAYAHRHREREAYQWNAELSIYLDPAACSGGVGKRLYAALMELLRLQGVRTVYGAVTVPNPKSEGLHEALGFSRLGVFHRTGFKNGRWLDVAWFEKQIAPYEETPAPFVPFSRVAERERVVSRL